MTASERAHKLKSQCMTPLERAMTSIAEAPTTIDYDALIRAVTRQITAAEDAAHDAAIAACVGIVQRRLRELYPTWESVMVADMLALKRPQPDAERPPRQPEDSPSGTR